MHPIDTDTSCASSLDERVGRLTDDEDVDEKPAASISMFRAAGSFVMSPSHPPPAPRRSPRNGLLRVRRLGLDFNEAMSSEMRDEPFYRDAFYRSPSRSKKLCRRPYRPRRRATRTHCCDRNSEIRRSTGRKCPSTNWSTSRSPGPLALVACDDDVETVSGDVDVDFADP